MLRTSAISLMAILLMALYQSSENSIDNSDYQFENLGLDDSTSTDSNWLYLFYLDDIDLGTCGYVNGYGDTIVYPGSYDACFTEIIEHVGQVYKWGNMRENTAYAINTKGEVVCKLFQFNQYPDDPEEGLVRFFTDDSLIGYINEFGEVAIPAKYKVAGPFTKGLATVAKSGYSETYNGELYAWHSDEWTYINEKDEKVEYSYLALGDSYTVGQSVEPEESWPNLLSSRINEWGHIVKSTKIIAQTGWRTDDMLKAAKKELGKKEQFEVVSLQIGVNNEYQGWDAEKFKPEFEKCLAYAISKCSRGKKGVFVLSIPDYGYSPHGKPNQEKISARLDQYNAICKEVCASNEIAYYDITGISRSDIEDTSLIAGDGLHPSAKQYELWVKEIIYKVFRQFYP